MKTKVIIIQRIFSNYRKPVFDEIAKLYDLTVLHTNMNTGIKQEQTAYSKKIKYFKYGKSETNVFLFTFYYIFKKRPEVVIHEFAIGILSLTFTYILSKILKAKFILWGHGYDRNKGFKPEYSKFDAFRLFLMKHSDAIILYGYKDKEKLSQFIQPTKIFVAQNTIDTSKLVDIRNTLEKEGKENIKKRLNIKHEINLIFIGRMLKSKKPEMLLDIYEMLKNNFNMTVGVHLVGEGEMLSEIIRNVHLKGFDSDFYFHGTINDNLKSGELLFISNLMVMLGYLGLSINHSFCFDCPVLSLEQGKSGPFHSPEIEYLIHSKTGFLIREHSITAIVNTSKDYLVNDDLQIEMKRNIREMVENDLTIKKMIQGIIDCIDSN